MGLSKKNKGQCRCLFILLVFAEALPIYGALSIFDSSENVPDSHSKRTSINLITEDESDIWVKCFKGRQFKVLSLVDDVITKLNSTYHVEECFQEEYLENISSRCKVFTTMIPLIPVELLLLGLFIPHVLLVSLITLHNPNISQTCGMRTDKKLEAINSTPRTLQYLHEFVQGIKIFHEELEHDIIALLFDDQSCECPNSPEADVLPEQGLVRIV